jgi:hypothetical protein
VFHWKWQHENGIPLYRLRKRGILIFDHGGCTRNPRDDLTKRWALFFKRGKDDDVVVDQHLDT